MSRDPVTDEIRRQSDTPFASRPLGELDENFEIVPHQIELIDTIRIAVEENMRRRRKAIMPDLRLANEVCLQFWHDAARFGMNFGFPPRTHIVLSRMYDWQKARIYLGKQKRFEGNAQGEMRAVLEKCWCSLVLESESIGKPMRGVFS